MKASDLRIGNTIRKTDSEIWNKAAKGTITTVKLFDVQILAANPDKGYYEPVQLTAEIVQALGFKKKKHIWDDQSISEDDYWLWQLDYFLTDMDNGEFALCCKDRFENKPQVITFVKSMHHLQNAFHSVTGIELTYGNKI